MRKVGKTTRPFRYDPNKIPYDYTVEVRNRFKGLDLIRMPEELWTEVRDIQEGVIKTIPKKKKCKKEKWLKAQLIAFLPAPFPHFALYPLFPTDKQLA